MTSTTQQELARSYAVMEGALATELQKAVSAATSNATDVQLVLADLIGTMKRHQELADPPQAAAPDDCPPEPGVVSDLERWQARLDRDRALGSSSTRQARSELAELAGRVAVLPHTPA